MFGIVFLLRNHNWESLFVTLFLVEEKFNAAVITQYKAMACGQLSAKQVFGDFSKCFPDLSEMFPIHKARFFKRGSSAHWESPPMRQSQRLSSRPTNL